MSNLTLPPLVTDQHVQGQLNDFFAKFHGGDTSKKVQVINGIPADANRYDTLGGEMKYHKFDDTGFYFWSFGSWVRHGEGYPVERTTLIGQAEPKRMQTATPKAKPVQTVVPASPIYTNARYKGD
ncbi:hypothetical protein EC844_12571 [Acinetobacter calcoaceticus]|uniref:Uncharacterized protein n=1 Tax=Acinetobacter calcoaceticus TaxID=471 RepID=A0A4R1XRP6_ACICA|nr:hypothetical protein EC844_12571 [Acinetobacter calcoaceticus]